MSDQPLVAGTVFDTSYEKHDKDLRARHGMLWGSSELVRLQSYFCKDMPLQEMCEKMERPAAGILAKLVQARLLSYSVANNTYTIRMPGHSSTPTSKENTMSAIVIENNTTVNGKDIKEMSDSDLYNLIAQQETAIEKLSAIKHQPKRLKEELAKRQAGIEALVALLDAQG